MQWDSQTDTLTLNVFSNLETDSAQKADSVKIEILTKAIVKLMFCCEGLGKSNHWGSLLAFDL